MKIKRTTRKAHDAQTIIMDRDSFESITDILGQSLVDAVPEEDEKSLTYTSTNDRTSLEIVFSKETISKLKKQLQIQDQDTQISVGHEAWRFWCFLILQACEQSQDDETKIKGRFKYSDAIKTLKLTKGGKQLAAIRNQFISFASVRFAQKYKIGEKTRTDFFGLIADGNIIEDDYDSEATEFSFTLDMTALGRTVDSDAFGGTESFIRWGSLTKSQQQKGYVKVPKRDWTIRNKNSHYFNFRNKLRLFAGNTVSAEVVLKDWIKLGNDKLRRRGFCHDLLINCLEQAKAENELKDYRAKLPTEKGWLEKWMIHITANTTRTKTF